MSRDSPSGLHTMTANRLRDGAVVFLAAGSVWTTDIDRAEVAADAASAQRLAAVGERDAAAQIVVGPYLIAVERRGRGLHPLVYRERIRAFGPSVAARHPERLSA